MDENPMTTTSPVTTWECKNNLGTIHPPPKCQSPDSPKYPIKKFYNV